MIIKLKVTPRDKQTHTRGFCDPVDKMLDSGSVLPQRGWFFAVDPFVAAHRRRAAARGASGGANTGALSVMAQSGSPADRSRLPCRQLRRPSEQKVVGVGGGVIFLCAKAA